MPAVCSEMSTEVVQFLLLLYYHHTTTTTAFLFGVHARRHNFPFTAVVYIAHKFVLIPLVVQYVQ